MNCQFCYTGRMGLSGNLSTAQIVEQVRAAAEVASALPAVQASAHALMHWSTPCARCTRDWLTATRVCMPQMVAACRLLAAEDAPDKAAITNVVFMVRRAVALCSHSLLPGMGLAHAVERAPCLHDCTPAHHAPRTTHQGMGEPLDNMAAVLAAVDIMTHPLGLHMSRYKVRAQQAWLHPRGGGRDARSCGQHRPLCAMVAASNS
jgi:hypothetical protein